MSFVLIESASSTVRSPVLIAVRISPGVVRSLPSPRMVSAISQARLSSVATCQSVFLANAMHETSPELNLCFNLSISRTTSMSVIGSVFRSHQENQYRTKPESEGFPPSPEEIQVSPIVDSMSCIMYICCEWRNSETAQQASSVKS